MACMGGARKEGREKKSRDEEQKYGTQAAREHGADLSAGHFALSRVFALGRAQDPGYNRAMAKQGDPRSRWPRLQGLLFLVVMIVIAGITITSISPPAPRGSETPLTEFSSTRALEWLRPLTLEHRPLGSPGHELAKQALLAEFRRLGVDFDVQNATVVNSFAGWHKGARLANVVGRIRGRDSTGSVAFVAHYDSVTNSRGASDNGAAVAALLEAARALLSKGRPRNDIVLLFTDAEEIGTLGASAFAFEHPWAADVKMLFNFEARGSHGPSAMFETSVNNGWIVEEFARAVPRPIGNSFIAAMAKLLPNDTDFTVFRKAGLVGLNFAYADGLHHYHSHVDDLANLDPGSLQHHGEHALGLMSRFGDLDLRREHEPSVIYFDVFARGLVSYGCVWNWVLLFVLLVGVGVVMMARFKELGARALGMGFVLVPIVLVATVLIASGISALLSAIEARLLLIAWSKFFFVALLLVAGGALTIALEKLHRWIPLEAVTLAALSWWALLAGVTTWMLPGMAYLFQWPLLFALVAFVLSTRGALGPRPGWVFAALLVLGPGFVFFWSHTTATTLMLDGGVTPAIPLIFFVLFGLLARGVFPVFSEGRRRALARAALVLGLALLPTGAWLAEFSVREPMPNTVIYAVDHGEGRARWLSDGAPDEWTAQFLGSAWERLVLPNLGVSRREVVAAEAPRLPWEPAEIKLLVDRGDETSRTVELEIHSPRQAPCFTIWEDSDNQVTGMAVNGREPFGFARFSPEFDKKMFKFLSGDRSTADWRLVFCGLGSERLRLELSLAKKAPIILRLVETTYGLPSELTTNIAPRPAWMIPSQRSDVSLSGAVYGF